MVGKGIIKLGKEGLVKGVIEKWLRGLFESFMGKGEATVELTGLRVRVGRVELEFEGRTKAKIRFVQ